MGVVEWIETCASPRRLTMAIRESSGARPSIDMAATQPS